ncbi:IclR family transcriptional regulator C-terminal domain-containing protein [Streptomyces sp. NPDC023838]|uniref:IclR family transcriptional regulator domain-containing protein n=1 Tax=Streptomyces sp. NPDC023838 TaxID=3154325 RepID=UPI0033C24757
MSRDDDHHDGVFSTGRPEPVVPAGLADLLAHLAGPSDFWDRPEGDFGPLSDAYELTRGQRAHANSLYRLGSKALARGELRQAADWLGTAAAAGHPGALFRLAALTARVGGGGSEDEDEDVRVRVAPDVRACVPSDVGACVPPDVRERVAEDVRFLVAEAARHGHGDARVLLAAATGRALPTAGPGPGLGLGPGQGPGLGGVEDPLFIDEVRAGIGLFGQGPDAPRRLVLVPPPRLDSPAGAGHEPAGPVPSGRLLLPPGRPALTTPPPPPRGGEREPWSANALRPAVLTDMARGTLAHTDTPEQWKAAVKALDILYLVEEADGTSTRALARRSGLPLSAVTWLLHWLRGQHFVSTVAGAHFPGPLMGMTGGPEQRAQLLEQTLAGLRDDLGAAVYVSGYTDGDVTVFQSAHGPQAPAVREWVDFRDAAHASAVGKSLLAQLDFAGRMDHLARHRPIRLTERTITNPRALFEALDGHGPLAGQFDLLEYSHHAVCAAFSLGIPGRTASVALSLPAGQRHRLLDAARALSERSAGLLLVLLLTEQADRGDRASGARRPPPGPAAVPTARALPRVRAGVSLTRVIRG